MADEMSRIVPAIAVVLALGFAMPRRAFADELRSSGAPAPTIVLSRASVSLELPARMPLLDPLTDGLRSTRSPFAYPATREVRLSEDGLLVVVAAAVVGVVLLVVIVTGLTN